jgi:hypothetical protein
MEDRRDDQADSSEAKNPVVSFYLQINSILIHIMYDFM